MLTLLQPDAATFELKPYKSLSNDELRVRIAAIRAEMGQRLLILGHHYQQDEVIALSDLQGDSYQLSKLAADSRDCRAIVFCGVHFMAETADVLANRPERLAERAGERVTVVLPDMAAGCSMADMAAIEQVENCWESLAEVMDTREITPVTYINSAASLKGILRPAWRNRLHIEQCRRRAPLGLRAHAPRALLSRSASRTQHGPRDGHSAGRNGRVESARRAIRRRVGRAIRPSSSSSSRVLLWQGHCSVHAMFRPEHVDQFRARFPGIKVLVHPECAMEVVEKADLRGSTSRIIREVEAAPPGTRWAIGTELHLVNRLKHEHPEQEIHFLSPVVCMCATMYRIDLAHLCWSLENLAAGSPVNIIRVDDETARWALIALERMLTVK